MQTPAKSTVETQLDVDVVIAVHTPTRPVERAVASVLDHTSATVRVTVVVHNTELEPIHSRLKQFQDDARLRLVHHVDGFSTPAGPKNAGLAIATAEFVAMLDSDDQLEPGALDAWLFAARQPMQTADFVIAPSSSPGGRLKPSPPVRWSRVGRRRSARLDPSADRLFYRASPLGLIGRERFGHVRFSEGIATGEDQALTAEVWSTPGAQIVFPVFAPRYLEFDDQGDRVTREPRAVAEEFRSLDFTLAPGAPWATSSSLRLALATKLIRIHLFDGVRQRLPAAWDSQTATALAEVAERILDWEPRASQLLSRADANLLHAVLTAEKGVDRMCELQRASARLRSFPALVPQRFARVFHAQAPLRYHLAGALLRLRTRRR